MPPPLPPHDQDRDRPPLDDFLPDDPVGSNLHIAHAFQLVMLHGASRQAWEDWRRSGDHIPRERTAGLSAERAAKLASREDVKDQEQE